MADTGGVNGTQVAILLGVYATFALDVFSTLNSSPQTTELFAGSRENSLMHWVKIGDAAAIGGGLVASVVSKKVWPLVATLFIVALMHYLYKHAVKRGIDKPEPDGASEY